MNYRNYSYILIFLFLIGCSSKTLLSTKSDKELHNNFTKKGFALLYKDSLYKNDIISKKIDERSLVIFQRNLNKNSTVKLSNLLNGKSIIAKVGNNAKYPSFNNSVVSLRIFNELELNLDQPYIEIILVQENSMFLAKKAKTFEEEKEVANKAPVDSIIINDLNKKKIKTNKIKKITFSYNIKIADFYFIDSAKSLVKRIKKETSIKQIRIKKLSKDKYRVYLGPFNNIKSLQNGYNDVNMLEFENLEIIKND